MTADPRATTPLADDIPSSAPAIVYRLTGEHERQLHLLYQNEWWSKGRTLDETRRVVAGSQVCIGLTDATGKLIGFSRVLTDFTFKALVFDVIIAPEYRRAGLGDRLVSLLLEHEDLQRVRSWELYCLPELVPFYARHGFSDDVGGIRLMRRTRSSP